MTSRSSPLRTLRADAFKIADWLKADLERARTNPPWKLVALIKQELGIEASPGAVAAIRRELGIIPVHSSRGKNTTSQKLHELEKRIEILENHLTLSKQTDFIRGG